MAVLETEVPDIAIEDTARREPITLDNRGIRAAMGGGGAHHRRRRSIGSELPGRWPPPVGPERVVSWPGENSLWERQRNGPPAAGTQVAMPLATSTNPAGSGRCSRHGGGG